MVSFVKVGYWWGNSDLILFAFLFACAYYFRKFLLYLWKTQNSWKLFLNFNWICMFVEMIKFSSACYFHSWRIYLLEMASWRANSNFYLFPFQLQSWDWTLSTVVPGLLRMLELPIAESFTFAIVILLGQIGRSVTVLLLNIKAL